MRRRKCQVDILERYLPAWQPQLNELMVNETTTRNQLAPWGLLLSFLGPHPSTSRGSSMLQALFSSFLLVAISEFGDKTQLLALVLTLRFRRPWAIMAGILVATLLNHGLAAWVGGWAAQRVDPDILRYVLAGTFFAFAAWILIPDKDDGGPATAKYGAFLTTRVTFFLAEMGDKTQLATVALGARFQAPVIVTVGTTLGMLVADGLAVFLGERLTKRIPLKYVQVAAALLFAVFGVTILVGFAF